MTIEMVQKAVINIDEDSINDFTDEEIKKIKESNAVKIAVSLGFPEDMAVIFMADQLRQTNLLLKQFKGDEEESIFDYEDALKVFDQTLGQSFKNFKDLGNQIEIKVKRIA